jgi:hypothetical protein
MEAAIVAAMLFISCVTAAGMGVPELTAAGPADDKATHGPKRPDAITMATRANALTMQDGRRAG